ncbi:unnamed protein product [Sphenostylis stenocarpa]|uniref:Uncharacterized protein n=1 Tax=Sphenostylis stenocarpa TaxID=92480 RepID=A0AA86SII7_9FABA|nr:unnamed protein product [Sphenostylis stenocarpa]
MAIVYQSCVLSLGEQRKQARMASKDLAGPQNLTYIQPPTTAPKNCSYTTTSESNILIDPSVCLKNDEIRPNMSLPLKRLKLKQEAKYELNQLLKVGAPEIPLE